MHAQQITAANSSYKICIVTKGVEGEVPDIQS